MTAHIIVRYRREDNPMVGTIAVPKGIVANSFSTDVTLIEGLAVKLAEKETDRDIFYKVETVGEYQPS